VQTHSLEKHPRSDIVKLDYSDAIEDNELHKAVIQKERQAGNTLNYGLARVPVPNR
jgi:hypothetical protein